MASYKTISSPFKFSGSLNNFERDVIEKKKMSDKKSYGAYPDLFTVICSDIDDSTGQPGPDHGKLFIIDKSRVLDPVYGYCVPAGGDLPSNVTRTFTEMPDPESYTTGTIVQYVGADTPEYDSGNFYKVTETTSGDHEWHHVSQGKDDPETKNYTEAVKEMPDPEEYDEGTVVQYIGADSSEYTSGNFYKVVEKPGEVPPYAWEHVLQGTPSIEAFEEMPDPSKYAGKFVQYIGEDTAEYAGGNFYKAVEKPGEVPPYAWEHVLQGAPSIVEVFEEMPDPSKYDKGTVAQYVGPDTDDYSTGNFYKVDLKDGQPVWQHISQGADVPENITEAVKVMPDPSKYNEGTVVQYVGPDTDDYSTGNFYTATNKDGQLVWQHVSQGPDIPETKDYTEAVKEMPDPEEYAGKFVQYIGEDTAEYAGGNFYKAVEDSEPTSIPSLYPMTGSFSYIFNGDYKTLEVVMKGESRKVGDPIYSLTFDDDRQAHLKQIGKIKELSPLSLEGLGGASDTEDKAISDLIDSFDGVHKATSVSSEPREYEKSTNPSLRPQPLFSLYFTPNHTSYNKIWWQYTHEGMYKEAEIVIPVDPNYQRGYDVNDPYIYWAQLEHDGYNAKVVGKHIVAKIVEEIDIPADAVGFEPLAHCYKLEKYTGQTEPGSEVETVRNMISNAIDQIDGLFFIFEMINTRELGSTGNTASYWLDFDKYFPSSETSLLYMLGDPVYFYCNDSYEAYMLSYPLHPEWPDQMDVTVVMFKNSDYDHPAIWSYNGKIASDDGLESFKYCLTEAATDPGSPSKFHMEYESSYDNAVRDAFFEAAGFFHESGPGPYHYTKSDVPQSVTPWTMYRKGEQPYKESSYKWEHVEQGSGGGGGHDADLFNGTGKVNINNFANIEEYTDFSFVDFMKIATSTSPTFSHIFVNTTDTRVHGEIVDTVRIRFTMVAPGTSPVDTSTVKVNNSSVSETYTGSGVYEYAAYNISDTTNFVLTGKCNDGSAFTYTCTLKFVYPWYYGTLSKNTSIIDGDIYDAIASGKLKAKLEDYTKTSRGETTPAQITSDGEYVAFVTACDSPKIKDQNGFVNTMDFTQAATISLHTATYYVYVSKNICVCTNFEYTVE